MSTTSNSFQLHEMDGTPVNSSGYGQYENGAGGLVTKSLMRLDSGNGIAKTTMSSDLRVMGTTSLHGELVLEGARGDRFFNPGL